MSHVTNIRLRVSNLDALDEACEKLGLELRRDQKSYCWWGTYVGDSRGYSAYDPKTFGRSEHAIRIKGDVPKNGSVGPWEIGLVKAADGEGYDLLYDTYGSAGARLTAKVGSQANKLKQEYACATATRKAVEKLSRHGWRVQREDLPTGAIRLRLTKR